MIIRPKCMFCNEALDSRAWLQFTLSTIFWKCNPSFDHVFAKITCNLRACCFVTVLEYCCLFSVSELSSHYTACSYACIKSYKGSKRFSRFFYWNITAKRDTRRKKGKLNETILIWTLMYDSSNWVEHREHDHLSS